MADICSTFNIVSTFLKQRDFEEVRAVIDSKTCISESVLLTNLPASSIEGLVSHMVSNLLIDANHTDELVHAMFLDKKIPIFRETIQGYLNDCKTQSWLIAVTSSAYTSKRKIAIATLENPINFGLGADRVKIFALVICPIEIKMTKNSIEVGYTLGTIFSSPHFRSDLLQVQNSDEFKELISERTKQLVNHSDVSNSIEVGRIKIMNAFVGVVENFTRRSKFYLSDFLDGIDSRRTINKVIATTFFLYFLCLLPCVAFGVLNANNTENHIDADRALVGQALGGLLFAFIAGQPFVIIATTAPIALCNKIVQELSVTLKVDFFDLYALTGICNCIFMTIYGILGLNSLIKFSTRSIEEIFSMFIVVCFSVDALKDLYHSFENVYLIGQTEQSLLFLFLLAGTVSLAVIIRNLKFSVYLASGVRDILSDYALPIAVIFFSFIGSFAFKEINVKSFPVRGLSQMKFTCATFGTINGPAIGAAIGLGFAMSLLFFMDQGVSAQLVAAPTNKLVKGNANDLDLLNVAAINVVLSLFGLPWMHGLLPHSPLHVQAMADFEEKVTAGHVERVVVRVRETRLTAIFCHVLILITIWFLPKILSQIPVPVLDGLFLYCALASLDGNSFFERFCLLFTQQSKYPPSHCIRRCPQRVMHIFTVVQVFEIAFLVFVGYAPWPYLQITFPVFIALLIPFRHFIITRFIKPQYLAAIDSYH